MLELAAARARATEAPVIVCGFVRGESFTVADLEPVEGELVEGDPVEVPFLAEAEEPEQDD